MLQQRQRLPVVSHKTQLHTVAFNKKNLWSPNATKLLATDTVFRTFNPESMLVIFIGRTGSIQFKIIPNLCYFHSLSHFHI